MLPFKRSLRSYATKTFAYQGYFLANTDLQYVRLLLSAFRKPTTILHPISQSKFETCLAVTITHDSRLSSLSFDYILRRQYYKYPSFMMLTHLTP